MKRSFIALAAIGSTMAAATIAAPALAAPQGMVIEYSDLNLSSERGQKTLAKRIDKAAREVCGMNDIRTGTRLQSRGSKKCYRDAKAKASKQFASVVQANRLGG